MKTSIILLAVSIIGCSVELSETNAQIDSVNGSLVLDPETEILDQRITPNIKVCVSDRFYADQIPANYFFDLECPPEIIYPPKLILPNDKGPVMLPEVNGSN